MSECKNCIHFMQTCLIANDRSNKVCGESNKYILFEDNNVPIEWHERVLKNMDRHLKAVEDELMIQTDMLAHRKLYRDFYKEQIMESKAQGLTFKADAIMASYNKED